MCIISVCQQGSEGCEGVSCVCVCVCNGVRGAKLYH